MSIFGIGWIISSILTFGILKNNRREILARFIPNEAGCIDKYGSLDDFGILIPSIFLGAGPMPLAILTTLIWNWLLVLTRVDVKTKTASIGLCYQMPKYLCADYKDGFPLQITDNRSK